MADPPTEASLKKRRKHFAQTLVEVQKFVCGQQHLHAWLKEKTRTDVPVLMELVERLQIRFSGVFPTALCSLARPSSCKAFSKLLTPELQLLCLTGLAQSSRSMSAFSVCLQLFQQGMHAPGNDHGNLGGLWRKHIGE